MIVINTQPCRLVPKNGRVYRYRFIGNDGKLYSKIMGTDGLTFKQQIRELNKLPYFHAKILPVLGK